MASPKARRKNGPGCLLVFVGAVVVVVIAVGSGSKSGSKHRSSTGLPQGRWGLVIICLENHPLLKVFDAYSANGGAPGRRTKALDVWQNLKGIDVAYVGDNGAGADDVTGSGATDVSLRAGPIHYGFTSHADAQNRSDVAGCVTRYYAASRHEPRVQRTATSTTPSSVSAKIATKLHACGGVIRAGGVTSCPFAQNVYSAVVDAYAQDNAVPSKVAAASPVTHKTYSLACASISNSVVCTDSTESLVIFPSSALTSAGASTSTVPATAPSTTEAVEQPGSYSHATDDQFCSTHSCIENFPNGSGSIVQCVDGEWSHSGGESGACSDHGGES